MWIDVDRRKMTERAELLEKEWWNRYADLEGRIWSYNRFLSWVVRRGYLKEMVACLYRPGGRVLDIGCGDGWVGLRLAQKGMRLDGIDLSEAQVELARGRAQALGLDNTRFWCASAAELPQGVDYEGVILHAALHHLNQAQRQDLLEHVGALLAPGGRLYMYEPITAALPQPLSARALDRGIGTLIRSLKRLSRALRLTEEDIRLAVQNGWTMGSPNEAPIVFSQIESELPPELELLQVRYWHVFSISYANFCMELKPIWQALFSPAVILFHGLDRVIFGLGIGPRLQSWPMATIMIEKVGF
jgi:2-polyprenyl-3-methyl-5-hydroxy-6-metoxy-1,4-benzoquinol methylase